MWSYIFILKHYKLQFGIVSNSWTTNHTYLFGVKMNAFYNNNYKSEFLVFDFKKNCALSSSVKIESFKNYCVFNYKIYRLTYLLYIS